MTAVLAVLASILPVILFLGALVLIDSYKLVALRAVMLSVGAGVLAALASWAANVWLADALALDRARYTMYVAPFVEELLKAGYVVYLLRAHRVGFVVDAAIHGFAIGTGFALLENLYYLLVTAEATLWTWIVRGCGAAIMHGGATAIVAMVAKTFQHRADAFRLHHLLPGLGVAIVLHSLYNHFLVNPLLATALIALVFPALSVAVFQHSERETQSWLGTGFDTDQELLRVIRSGQMGETRVGRYLKTLRTSFPPEVLVDMMCLLRLRVELSIRAKGALLLKEAGFDVPHDPTLAATFEELRYLEKSIGRTGLLAMAPFVAAGTRDLWQLHMLSGR